MKEEPVKISAYVPKALREAIRRYVARKMHLNESDFIRDALREKIQREASDIYQELLKEGP